MSIMGMQNNSFSLRVTAVLYWFIVAAFGTLEPWGNIDTRDFSYMGAAKFWEYNTYIVVVLLGMVFLGIALWRGHVHARTVIWMGAINALFCAMVLFDLLRFFPDAAKPMSRLTASIEIVTASIALGILAYAPRLVRYRMEK